MSTTEIPANAIRGREMYRAGKPRNEILAETGLTLSQLYHWLAGGSLRKDGGGRLLPEIELRLVRGRRVMPGERQAVIRRIMHISMQQMDAIKTSGTTALQRERDARTLGLITRTLSELTVIDERNRQMKRRKTMSENDRPTTTVAGPVRPDIEELRRSVARKLQNLINEQQG